MINKKVDAKIIKKLVLFNQPSDAVVEDGLEMEIDSVDEMDGEFM